MPPDPGLAAGTGTAGAWVKAVGNTPEQMDFILCPQAENIFSKVTLRKKIM